MQEKEKNKNAVALARLKRNGPEQPDALELAAIREHARALGRLGGKKGGEAKQRAAASNIMRRWATFLVEWSDGHYEQCRGESADTVAQRMARERYGIRATANRTTGVVFGSGMFQAKRGNMKKAGDPFAVTLVSPAEAHTQLDNK